MTRAGPTAAANPELTSSYSAFVNNEGTNAADALPVAGTLATPTVRGRLYPLPLLVAAPATTS